MQLNTCFESILIIDCFRRQYFWVFLILSKQVNFDIEVDDIIFFSISDLRMHRFCPYIVVLLLSVSPSVTAFNCRLYGIDRSSIETEFIQIFNSSSYARILNLGHSSFSGTTTSIKIDNQKYASTYHTYDSLGAPHYFLLIIDIHSKTIELNLTLNEKRDSGSFWQIATPSRNEIIGIRESSHSGSSLEVAKINQTNGLMETIGTYPTGSYSIIMTYASKRRLYYNVLESTFYAVNIDTGKLDINIRIPNGYTIYGIDYDTINDRLIALVYSASIGNGWILTQIAITANNEIKFDRIGKTIIPFERYLWTTTYAMSANERLWITMWAIRDTDRSMFIVFNMDSGEVTEESETNFKDFNNLVCSD
jgi:hypothetical protein